MKTVIITGGNKGIGFDIVKSFLDANYNVIVGARSDNGFQDKLSKKVTFKKMDVKNQKDHFTLIDIAIKEFGGLDCFVNNAGFSAWKPIEEIDEDFIEDILSTNLKGTFWGCKAASSVMKEGASIINISSIAGKRGSANNSAYCSSKFGVNGLTQSLSKELGPRGIRVNALCPVLIKTEGLSEALLEKYSPAKLDPDKFISDFARDNAALKRLPTGKEVGDMAVFLASDNASAITGQCINVDCGVFPQ
jgi:3-oxoacyl-[acyl-carrier protein] reductase/meso-butanediol dehydrogenase/(S,S)-butanediol dehydrogenase/diacetyl reductase